MTSSTRRKLKIVCVFYHRAWNPAGNNQYSLNIGEGNIFRFKSDNKSLMGFIANHVANGDNTTKSTQA